MNGCVAGVVVGGLAVAGLVGLALSSSCGVTVDCSIVQPEFTREISVERGAAYNLGADIDGAGRYMLYVERCRGGRKRELRRNIRLLEFILDEVTNYSPHLCRWKISYRGHRYDWSTRNVRFADNMEKKSKDDFRFVASMLQKLAEGRFCESVDKVAVQQKLASLRRELNRLSR